jgi:hypothetical protein
VLTRASENVLKRCVSYAVAISSHLQQYRSVIGTFSNVLHIVNIDATSGMRCTDTHGVNALSFRVYDVPFPEESTLYSKQLPSNEKKCCFLDAEKYPEAIRRSP